MNANVSFRDWLDEEMQDPAFRDAMEDLEPAYQVASLRMRRGLTQEELARLVGTRQSSISRLESGKSQPTFSFLRRIAKALNAQVVMQLVPDESQASSTTKSGVAPAEEVVVQQRRVVIPEPAGALLSLWQASPDSPTVVVEAPQEPWQMVRPADVSFCSVSISVSTPDVARVEGMAR